MSKVNEILSQVGRLSPLPDTAVKLMQVINNPRSSVDEIVETIRYDQAVTGEVLRLCNSAYFGLSKTVSSLNDAMVCLGTAKVLQLVMSVHTSGTLAREQVGYGLAPGDLWRHSVAVALAASVVAKKIDSSVGGIVFTAGLLHDIGKVVLNEYVAEDFSEIVRQVTEEHKSFAEAEHCVLGFSHEEIGAKIAEMWQLPEPIVRCIRYHHIPSELETPDELVDAVHLANCICLLLGLGVGEDGLFARADTAVMDRHNLHENDLEEIGAQTLIDLKQVEEVFADSGKKGDSRSKASVAT